VFVTCTEFAAVGPRFVTVIVYVSRLLTVIGSGAPVASATKSA